jgi:hypothetical protein
VNDPRLAELSGLVVDGDALWAMADGGSRVQVHRIDPGTCAIAETRSAPIDPDDPEDLARGPDGALWVSDTGDNGRRRATVAVIVLPAQGKPQLHRLTYPDGPHDAEALLVDAQGRPVIVTKSPGQAGIYRTEAPPQGTGPTPLVRVGDLSLPRSDTVGGPIGGAGAWVVTGAAQTADGAVVALRSYTDAWLFPVPDGDVVAALKGEPVRVPLPGEPQGEAIAFRADGTLLSGSETRGSQKAQIRAVPGAVGLVPGVRSPSHGGGVPVLDSMPEWLPAALGGGVVVVALVALTGALALRRR